MYKLLLVSDRPEVQEAFSGILDMNRLMFDPIAQVASFEEAQAFLQRPGADAVAFDPEGQEARPLFDLLDKHYPHLPIMRTHRRGDGLRNELTMLREVLDQLHGDFSDYDATPVTTQARLVHETLTRLMQERLANRNELHSRLLLARAKLRPELPALLFEFDLPEGAGFLASRWSHGFDRLDLSLAANFFGQIPGPLSYSSALLSPLRLRVLACSDKPLSEKELDVLSAQAQQLVLGTAAQVKIYMDLDLVCTRFTVLAHLEDLVPATT